MAQTYTYLATSDEVRTTTGKYYDDPTHVVNSSGYSRDPESIEKLMALTWPYLKTAESESSVKRKERI